MDPDIQAPELLTQLFGLGTQLLLDRLPDVWAGRGQQLAVPQVRRGPSRLVDGRIGDAEEGTTGSGRVCALGPAHLCLNRASGREPKEGSGGDNLQ